MPASSRKQALLKRHRRHKRLSLVLLLFFCVALGVFSSFWWVLPLLALAWLFHEAWFSDHLFYTPDADYAYAFGAQVERLPITFSEGRLTLAGELPLHDDDTLILAVCLKSKILGRFFDPAIRIHAGTDTDTDTDTQSFERGAQGLRYLNLTGSSKALRENGWRLSGRHCRVEGTPELWRAAHPDYRQKRLLIIAPHADDAELAAFGLYSQAKECWIVTLSAGEIEAGHYRRMGLDGLEAARLKGRLRAWDSLAVPAWGGIPAERCLQLGYFCLQLSVMRAHPEDAIASREAGLCDTRPFRCFNRKCLKSDGDGAPSWNNLLGDLAEFITDIAPQVIVLPHPYFDPHPDHIAARQAVLEALEKTAWQPETLLHYANHLHDNDRWPMGEAHTGVSLPPLMENIGPLTPWSLSLDMARQRDKAMALAMTHDLTTPLSAKRRLRRAIQRLFAGRSHPPYGENEFFRKAVRRHELFWVESWTEAAGGESTYAGFRKEQTQTVNKDGLGL
ncbi:MAG: PIG-L family deacetylase [Candidatus Accumulibacter sp.]|jgi:LmbE family N-acetylglucosaminyl deacetylase|nr:PIG-L family deacetylase [Accumulibacter sp.]